MAITTAITKPLDAGYRQVESTEKNGYKRYFKVPENYAGNFADELPKHNKKINLYSDISFFTAIFTGVLGSALFTKKMEGMKKFLIQSSAGIACAIAASIGFNLYAEDKENELLKRYKAKEIFYRA